MSFWYLQFFQKNEWKVNLSTMQGELQICLDQSTIMSKNIIVNFIIQKLKSKHTSLKKYTNWAKLIYFSLVLREREEEKNQIFRTLVWSAIVLGVCLLTLLIITLSIYRKWRAEQEIEGLLWRINPEYLEGYHAMQSYPSKQSLG